MKLFEPAFELARREVASMDDVRFIQVNHLHPSNDLHVRQFRTRRFDDLPEEVVSRAREARDAAQMAAIGDAPPHVRTTFFSLSGSMIHDLYGLRVLFGAPKRVVSTDIWADGSAYSTTLEYSEGQRCIATWVDLPELWDFHETLEVYGGAKRVIVKYGTGFSRTVSTLTVHEINADGTSVRKQPELDWESPFRRELRHFHDCIVNGTPNRSPVEAARDDIALIIDITRAYQSGGPIARTAERAR
jgi:predicted dehydrogenase